MLLLKHIVEATAAAVVLTVAVVHCVSKNIPNISDLKNLISDMNIHDSTGYRGHLMTNCDRNICTENY